MDNPETKPPKSSMDNRQMIGLAMDMGYIIALPLVAFAILGKYLDAHFGTKPYLTLAGIIIAITFTTIWLTKKIRTYIK